ncbi:MAG: PEGA domain-containing protein [Polyangia bacterium]
MKVAICAIAVAVALVAAVDEGRAQDPDQSARAQFELGIELYESGKHDEAAVAFSRAYELRPSYKILYNIAQTENERGEYVLALDAYRRYLADGGERINKRRRSNVLGEIERLEGLVGEIIVRSDVDGAHVFVDDRRVGETPLAEPIRVNLGDRELVVRLEADEIHRELVTVAGGKIVDVEVAVPTETAAVEDGSAGDSGGRLWTWISFGAAGAAAITGGVLGGVALSQRRAIEDDCVGGHCPAGLADDGDRVRGLSVGADVAFGVAAAAAAAGVVLFFVEPGLGEESEDEPPASEEPVSVRPKWYATPEGTGISIEGRF